MLATRVIPLLLLSGSGLVKTVRFKSPTYIGDPINAVRIFNEKEADEIILLDIEATAQHREPNYTLIEKIVAQAFMPLCYGGGVTTIAQMQRLYQLGIEKVALNSVLAERPELIAEASARFGAQSVVAGVDVKRSLLGSAKVVFPRSRSKTAMELLDWLRQLERLGAGEILLQSVERDGLMQGYDLPLLAEASHSISIPLVAAGGAGTIAHLGEAVHHGAHAAAAGSMFVYHGKLKGVLINMPPRSELDAMFAANGVAPKPGPSAQPVA